MRLTKLTAVFLCSIAVGCTSWQRPIPNPTPAQRATTTWVSLLNTLWWGPPVEQIVRDVPEFGGAYVDDHWNLVIYLTDLSRKQSAEETIRRAIGDSWLATRPFVFRQGKYGYRWLRQRRAMTETQVTFANTHVDARCNRIRVETNSDSAYALAKSRLQRLGSPDRDAIIIGRDDGGSATDCRPPRWAPRPDSACFTWARAAARAADRFGIGFNVLASQVPQFGGAFLDTAGFLNVYLTDLKVRQRAEQFAACDLKLSRRNVRGVRYLAADYTLAQLRDTLDHLPRLMGLTGAGFDMRRNRIVLWAATKEELDGIREAIKHAGISLKMFVFEIRPPVQITSALIRPHSALG